MHIKRSLNEGAKNNIRIIHVSERKIEKGKKNGNKNGNESESKSVIENGNEKGNGSGRGNGIGSVKGSFRQQKAGRGRWYRHAYPALAERVVNDEGRDCQPAESERRPDA